MKGPALEVRLCCPILTFLLVFEQGRLHFALGPTNCVAGPARGELEGRLARVWTRLPAPWAASPGCLHPGMPRARASSLHLASGAWPLPGKPEEHGFPAGWRGRERGPGCVQRARRAAGASPALRNLSRHCGCQCPALPSLPEFSRAFLLGRLGVPGSGDPPQTHCDFGHSLPLSEPQFPCL